MTIAKWNVQTKRTRRAPLATAAVMAGLLFVGLAATPAVYAQPNGCPPGLAKKGCVPPGQAKKWQVGAVVPQGTPYTVIAYRKAAPAGAQYIRVDQDVLLIAAATGRILEIIGDN